MTLHRRAFLASCAAVALSLTLSNAHAQVEMTDRAVRFVLNLYTGVSMQSRDWLTAEANQNETFRSRGGLAAIVRQSTAYAHQYGGVSGLHIDGVQALGGTERVVIRVSFRDDEQRRKSPAAAEREDIVWRLVAKQVRGSWVFALD